MQQIITTVRKFENGMEYLGYVGANFIGTHVRFFVRRTTEKQWWCVEDRDTPQRYTSIMCEFLGSGYTIID